MRLYKKSGNIKSKKGFTLVELIIAMAIASTVVSVAVSMLMFSNSVYKRGNEQQNVQSNNRLASDYIQKQVRFASDLYLTATPPTVADITDFNPEYVERIYINASNQLVHDQWDILTDSYKTAFITQYQIAGSNFTLNNNRLLINLSPSSDFELKSEIQLPNLLSTNPSSSGAQPVIVFTRDISSAGLAAFLETITFDTGSGGSYIAPISKAAGAPVTAPSTNPTRPGSTFMGWSPAFPTHMPVGGLSLTAIWSDVPRAATSIVVSGPNPATSGTSNDTLTYQYTAVVLDQFNQTMTGQTISWSASNMGGNNSMNSSTGLLSLRNFSGTSTTIIARVGTVTGSMNVSVN